MGDALFNFINRKQLGTIFLSIEQKMHTATHHWYVQDFSGGGGLEGIG